MSRILDSQELDSNDEQPEPHYSFNNASCRVTAIPSEYYVAPRHTDPTFELAEYCCTVAGVRVEERDPGVQRPGFPEAMERQLSGRFTLGGGTLPGTSLRDRLESDPELREMALAFRERSREVHP